MRLPKTSTEEPLRHIQNGKIYVFLIRKQTKLSSEKGAGAFPKNTRRSHADTSRITKYTLSELENKQSEFGEGCASHPKTHTEEPRRHIQNVKI